MNNVDIILPTYNCAEYIEEAINSVIGRTLENWKLIIIDDASKDSTTSLIKNYLNERKNSNFNSSCFFFCSDFKFPYERSYKPFR